MNGSPHAARPSILVVEDHRSLRLSIVTWLQYRFPGSLVQGVGSGEEALASARNAHLDVVLMDFNLPGIDGLEATCRMKAQSPKTAVVILTMNDTPRHRLEAAQAGAAGYIAKRDMETLLEATVECLLQSRSRP